jgi:hypothetical protein
MIIAIPSIATSILGGLLVIRCDYLRDAEAKSHRSFVILYGQSSLGSNYTL